MSRPATHRIIAACAAVLLGAVASHAGEVKFDGSFNSNASLPGPGYLIPAEAGKQAGGNLFHSFSKFNLVKGDTATFQAPLSGPAVGNILARVTDGLSNINGTIKSDIAGANLYLINPAGFLFGANASLDISGSFTAATANSIKLSDGERFKSTPGTRDGTLSAAPVSAFGFLPAPGFVRVNDSTLAVPAGKDISLLGGGVSLVNSTLQFTDSPAPVAPGRITLLATKSDGADIPADFATAAPAHGSVFLSGANIDASAQAGGSVIVRGRKLTVDGGAKILSDTRGMAVGGDMDIRVGGTAEIKAIGTVLTRASGGGKAGQVVIRAGKLAMNDQSTLGSQATDSSTASARAGRVKVRADEINISNESFITGSTLGLGRSSDVDVAAREMSLLVNSPGPRDTGILSNTSTMSTGRGGTVSVSVSGRLSIQNTAVIRADTLGTAAGGNVNVTAGDLLIDGAGTVKGDKKTGIFADTNLGGAGGTGGTVTVAADRLRILNGGLISTKTLGLGASGDTIVNAGLLKITRGSSQLFTGIAADSPLATSGPGGMVRVNADTIRVTAGGQISSNTFGAADGGNVTVNARDITLIGDPANDVTGITADSLSSTGIGRTGDLLVNAQSITIRDGARISATTFGQGNSGSLNVTATHLLIDGGTSPLFTGIAALTLSKAAGGGAGGDVNISATGIEILAAGRIGADTLGTGKGGRVNVTADTIHLADSGTIGVTALGTGDGGTLSIRARDIALDDFGSIEARTAKRNRGGAGGGIAITADTLTLSSGGQISAATTGSGAGGDIAITASLSLDLLENGLISGSTTGKGRGGSILIQTPTLTLDGGLIRADTSSTGIGGDITLFSSTITARSLAQITGQTNGPAIGGTIAITADTLTLTGGAAVSGETRGAGAGGSVALTVRDLRLDGESSGIKANSFDSGASGDLVVEADTVEMSGGAQIGASTSASGAGGSVVLTADTLAIDGGGTRTGIFADTIGAGENAGAGGMVRIGVGSLTLAGTGQISATTAGGGKAGDVQVTTGLLDIRSATLSEPTGIFAAASADATGNGGSITVLADRLEMAGPGSTIAASSDGGGTAGSIALRASHILLRDAASVAVTSARTDAGSVSLTSSTSIDLFDGASVTASAGANGGSVTLSAVDRFYLRDSSVTSVAGTATAGVPGAVGGAGGNIFIDPIYVILDHGLISANAAIGAGGNIVIIADNFLSSETLITATGTTAGTIVISAPQVDLSSGLVTLPAGLVDASNRLQERCTLRLGMQTSSFLVIGRGGVEMTPLDPLPGLSPMSRQ